MAREREVRLALRDALLATNEFSDVWLTGLPEDFGQGASHLAAAAIEPAGSQYAVGWDMGATLGRAYDATCVVTVLARHEDAQLRDDLAETLMEAVFEVVNGSALTDLAVAGRTGIRAWQWQPATPPERRIQAVVGFTFLAPLSDSGGAGAGFNPFPTRTAHQVWDLLCETLKTDPILAPRVRTWQLWRGDQDTIQAFTFSAADLPAVTLTPRAAPGEWMDERATKFLWPIAVELDISGTDARAAMDFWEAFASALFPDNNTLLNQLIPLKAWEKTMSSASYDLTRYADTSGYRASGLLSIFKWLPS